MLFISQFLKKRELSCLLSFYMGLRWQNKFSTQVSATTSQIIISLFFLEITDNAPLGPSWGSSGDHSVA